MASKKGQDAGMDIIKHLKEHKPGYAIAGVGLVINVFHFAYH